MKAIHNRPAFQLVSTVAVSDIKITKNESSLQLISLNLAQGVGSVRSLFLDKIIQSIKGGSDVIDLALGLSLDSIKFSDFEVVEKAGQLK